MPENIMEDTKNKLQETLLHRAVREGNLAQVKSVLIQHPEQYTMYPLFSYGM